MGDIQALEKKLQDVQARREAMAAAVKVSELEAQIKREERELEEDQFTERLKEANSGDELGIHFDFLRFGDYLVAFKKAPGPLIERWTKRLPKDGGQPAAAEVRNLARPCVTVVVANGAQLDNLDEAFDRVALEFPGAPVEIANVLLAMASGAAARRRKK